MRALSGDGDARAVNFVDDAIDGVGDLTSVEEVERMAGREGGLEATAALQTVTGPAFRSLARLVEQEDPGLARLPMRRVVDPRGRAEWVWEKFASQWQAGVPSQAPAPRLL